jgi:transcription-repair coupling factor (superfamily II helicase)
MTFAALVRAMGRSPLTTELITKLQQQSSLKLSGVPRLPKGLVASAIAQTQDRPLLVITATLEEASRWSVQLEAMGWPTVHLYPTSEASPYEAINPEPEMLWGQLQILADLIAGTPCVIVTTTRSLQPHLPPVPALRDHCVQLRKGMELDLGELGQTLARLGYERVPLVETEGQWSRRGDLIDIFPVAAELPVRLEWFGDELHQLREFDPTTQRSLDQLSQFSMTPTSFDGLIRTHLKPSDRPLLSMYLSPEQLDQLDAQEPVEGLHRFMGVAFDQPASLLDYLPQTTIIAMDEVEQCQAHSDRWWDEAEAHWEIVTAAQAPIPKLHSQFSELLRNVEPFEHVYFSELVHPQSGINLASRPVPAVPHQFGRLAQTIRDERDRGFGVWLVSAQPSRSVSLLQEHDCTAQFVPNPKDFQAIDRLQVQKTPIALKYSGLAELEGFILPTFRIVLVSDREFFGQHTLATPSYIRKRRRAASKQVDLDKLQPGDYVVHKQHGVGRFIKLESLTLNNETRDYLVLQYADGLLRVVADQMGSLSRYRSAGDKPPVLNSMTSKAWEKTKAKVRKAIRKVAYDLLKLYAQRSQQQGFAYPPDSSWQVEMEDSFPYQPTPDQLKATQDIKRDMEDPRPMDRLVCGDVGFGKTEVAIRAIFKAITAGKQVVLLAPTTILTQQHYHTLKERFAPYPIQVGLLNRFRTGSERKAILQRLTTGELDVLVGTHQVLSKELQFKSLGLLVIDEEQRFGVNQKEKIKALKTQIDVLTLTATPIPRTLYMSLSGVREMSLITTPPPSRRAIKTHLSPYDPEVIRSAIRQELDRGGQVFYVVPRIEGIEEISAQLREMLPGARLAIAHGQLPEAELEATMLTFSTGEADILLCTTIVESGLDIPRVNTIVIEDAQKFGLSQLYQLRGRVGRSGVQAYAWLFYPKQETLSDTARQRLRAIQEFTQLGSGYQLAMRDMDIRGVGNLLGVEQSGQLEAIGFDLYMDMLQDAIQEIQGQDIPQVDDTQIDLNLTAFIPANYIPDLDQKMSAYRSVAAAQSKSELTQIAAEWSDRYGPIPNAALQLMRVVELKQVARKLGFSRIKPDGKQHVVLETPMEEPAWNLLKAKLASHLHSRFVYSSGKVTVRGLGVMSADQQLDNLLTWLVPMQTALSDRC